MLPKDKSMEFKNNQMRNSLEGQLEKNLGLIDKIKTYQKFFEKLEKK